MRVFAATLALAVTVSGVIAQDPGAPEPEIRRAIPIPSAAPGLSSPQEFDNPAWMERVAPRQPEGTIEVRPAFPNAPEPPQSQPPVQEMPQPVIPRAEPVEDPNAIRLTPQGGGRDAAAEQLEKANSIYARKMYDFAAMEYETFLKNFPGAPGREAAFFRLGESYRALNEEKNARDAFSRLTSEFREGEFFGAGAYRLGEILFADSLYDPALKQFQAAMQHAGSEEVRLSAKYQAARCMDRLGQSSEAVSLFREVAAVEDNNPYRDYAKLALAGSLAASGKKQEALAGYEELAGSQTPRALRAEATVKAGALASELGDKKKAAMLFDKVLAMKEGGQWRAVAMLGALRLYASTGDHKKLTSITDEELGLLVGEYRAEALAMIAASHRQSGSTLTALEFYNRLAKEFPKSAAARRARFSRIVAMHELSDKKTRAELQTFLADTDDPTEKDRGTLLLAELLFQEGNFAEAAKSYAVVLDSGLSPDFRKQAQYKQAWCLANTGDHAGAARAFTAFVDQYPESEFVAPALAQRGLARQQLKEFQPALADFQKVIGDFPKAAERELSIQQRALILGQLEDYPAMKTAFLQLLDEYPQSKGAAQAEYWIGWADFEQKNYKEALTHLTRARELDPTAFGDRAGLRIALCHYYTEDRPALQAEVARLKPDLVPVDVHRWLGLRSAQESDFVAAEKSLDLVAKSGSADPESLIVLAESQNALGKNKEAIDSVKIYLEKTKEPSAKARGLLAVAEANRGLKDYDAALEAVNEALLMQPEGRLNAAGRMTVGEIEFSRGDYDAAARAFMTVALLYEDPVITPRALQRGAESYRRANNDTEAGKASDELQRRFPDFPKKDTTLSQRQ
ncbi:MAG: tetratricopeptide repeat protein [Terrimicrobiaceae bacterium]